MVIFLSLLLASLIIRLILAPLGFHVDILSIAGWGEWIYKFGTDGFYANGIWTYSWPTQTPLANLVFSLNYYLYQQLVWLFSHIALIIATYHLAPTYFLWWFDFVKWLGTVLYPPTSFLFGFLITIKLLAILADILIAVIIYLLARRENFRWAIFLSFAYLFSPFSWYLSSLWGQYDQIGFLFTLLAFIFFLSKFSLFSPLFFLIAILLKPTFLIFAPLFLWIYFKARPSINYILIGFVTALGLFIFSTSLFTSRNLFDFMSHDLIRIVFEKAEFRVSTHSFNFWHILIGDKAINQEAIFLFLPFKIWGYGIFLGLYLLAFRTIKKISRENLFKVMFLIGVGGWLFLTNVLERYFFAGVASLLFLCIYQPRLFKYWVILSLTFWLNLYHGWWFPEFLDLLKQTLIWQDGFITRIISACNVVIFLRVLWFIKPVINWRIPK